MVNEIVRIDEDIMAAYADVLNNSPRAYAAFVEGTVANDVRQEVEQVQQYPGPSVSPVEWANQIPPPAGKHANMPNGLWSKQKAFVLGFVLDKDSQGNIIPYQRKGTYFNSSTVVWDANTGTLSIRNTNPISRYVTWGEQQPFHANTGWVREDEEYLRIVIDAQDKLIDGYIAIIDIRNLA